MKSWGGQEVRKKRMTPGFAIWPTKWMRIHRLSWETWGWFCKRKNLPLSHGAWGFCGTSRFNIRVCGSGRVSAADWKSPAYDMKSRARTEFRKYGVQKKRGSPEQKPGGPYILGTWKWRQMETGGGAAWELGGKPGNHSEMHSLELGSAISNRKPKSVA